MDSLLISKITLELSGGDPPAMFTMPDPGNTRRSQGSHLTPLGRRFCFFEDMNLEVIQSCEEASMCKRSPAESGASLQRDSDNAERMASVHKSLLLVRVLLPT